MNNERETPRKTPSKRVKSLIYGSLIVMAVMIVPIGLWILWARLRIIGELQYFWLNQSIIPIGMLAVWYVRRLQRQGKL